MGMGATEHFTVQHARQADIGAIFGATGDFVYSIMPDWTGANHFEFVFLLRFHTHLPKDYEARRKIRGDFC
jgi:hypothetical protein